MSIPNQNMGWRPIGGSGITLLETLTIAGFVGIVASLCVPWTYAQRIGANEAAAIGGCKTLAAAQTDYNNSTRPHTYAGNLADLGKPPYYVEWPGFDPNLSAGLKSGYTFHLVGGSKIASSAWTWSATAWPVEYRNSGIRSFYIDETGTIRGEDAGGRSGLVSMSKMDCW